ncbi:DUF3168 domain-containing protein [Pararhodobacter oceanensis]|uniref:DUF3168 domain-containing protein n=1 Tax=Pararhodobacter oceanensis TaxID=2172121 RepID=A0A2T8HW34_9RHOB|nr:DUF3168 domain-containing protein [Pararhodobacter oceanensis]PVH29604.1 DUF3168 domain-containing protein [Pararhodobacter oceanensis]
MSYQSAAALQAALFTQLSADAVLAALLPDGIFDAPPPGTPQGSYCVIGAESVIDRSDSSGPGAEHRVEFCVVSDASGFATAKAAAARISQILPDTQPALSTGRVVAIWFHEARARRLEGGAVRRIDLKFRIRIEG